MSRFAWVRSPALLLLLAAACSTETTGPATGSLAVVVLGLPAGGSAAVTVTGPDGFSQAVSASQTLSGLTPGSYGVAAGAVNVGSGSYAPAPPSQSVTVTRSEVAASANVFYAASGGNLTVTVNGLPSGAAAPVLVTGPGGYSQPIPATRTLSLLPVGTYTITAEPVDAGCSQYTPSAATQSVAVDLSSAASAEVSYSAPASGGFNLCVNGMYLTQSVQTYAGTVPLVKDRDGYLRVFVTANEFNTARPAVRATFYSNGSLVDTKIINAPLGMLGTPQVPDESSSNGSWDVPVARTLIQPNLSVLIELDPNNTISEASEGDNVFPASGVPHPLGVQVASPFDVTLVPVLQSVNGTLGDVTEANKDEYLAAAMKMYPLSGYNVIVGAPMTTSQPAVEADNGNGAWNEILFELNGRRVASGGSHHYYGVLGTTYTSGVAGVGYVGLPTAVGWDRLPSASSVAAHEWGHNWNRNHAPCGGAQQLDTGYPYSGGTIGVFGFDLESATIKPASSHDLMGYCPDEWISDYTYRGVLNFRASAASAAPRMEQAVQPALLVWGRIENGVPVLEPAFQVTTRPTLPSASGPYTLEGKAEDGSAVFGIRFAPTEIADARNGGSQHFAFTVPMSPVRAARVATLRLAGKGRETSMSRSSAAPATVEVRPTTSGRVALTWDASRTPMVMVRDAGTGQILSFARGGRAEIQTDRRDLSLTLSNRVQSSDVRISVPTR